MKPIGERNKVRCNVLKKYLKLMWWEVDMSNKTSRGKEKQKVDKEINEQLNDFNKETMK